MSATYNANITIQQNASIAQTLYGGAANGSIYSPGGVPSLFISSSYSQSSGFVFNDGTVRVTGFNNGGQLGQNDLVTRSTLVPILGISSQAIAVAFGKSQTAILLNNGTVRVCGYNNSGQLGLNDLTTRSTVVSVLGISSQAVAVACGSYQTAILLNDGTIRVCGRNNSGQLGTNDLVTRSTVVSVLGISSQAISVSVGWFHMAAILNNGTVRVWGRNNAGNLGQNDLTIRSTSVPVLGISSQAIAACCGYDFTAILLNDGTVRVCGQNSNGQLGTNDLVTRSTVVSVLGISSQAIAIACGAYHTAILLNDGTVRVCGRNAEGQLGQNDLNNRSTVVSVLGISSQAIAVACGQYHTAILLNDGTIRVCGRNDFGQLGLNDAINRSTTVPVLGSGSVLTLIKTTNINSLFSSISFDSGFIMSDGTVRMCGLNSNGQLGQNDLVTRSTVVSVLGISSQAVSVACGQGHTAILLNDGTVRVCGRNSDGQLGQNDIVTRSTVVSVLGISSQAIAIACGGYHTAILLNDGTVRVCGLNSTGQLGVNGLNNRSTVVSVLGISSQAVSIACGQGHTAILLNNGTVRVCGQNNFGQLGTNDLVTRSTVVSVLGISSQAIAVACGYGHTAILLNNGTVRVCGRNNDGQLGQNDLVTRSTVVSVLGISSQAIAVACGTYHTAILLNDGTVRACGRNNFGQLGTNDIVTRSTLVPILGISSQAIAIACGVNHTAILLNNGTVRMCGRNAEGQLGVNDTNNRSTVVSVLGIGTLTLQAPSLLLGLTSASSYQLDMSTDNARKLTTSTWTTGSDQALKTNIVDADLERCVDIIQQLELKYFRWNIPSDDTHSLGWIAQDVEPLLPKAVTTSPTHGIPDFKDLNSDQIIKVMWGALKKLRAELKAKKTL